MRVSSYISPDEPDVEKRRRSVWVKCKNEDEYDITVVKRDEEWAAESVENVIADVTITKRDSDEVKQMKKMAERTVEAIVEINESV